MLFQEADAGSGVPLAITMAGRGGFRSPVLVSLLKQNVEVFMAILRNWSSWIGKLPSPMTDPCIMYGIYANIKGVFVDGIHGTPYIAAPLGCHGSFKMG